METKKRNGEIDVLRFVFSIFILLYHFGDVFKIGIAEFGFIGVEFFFVVSGILMARTAKLKDVKYVPFIVNKIKSFYPYYFLAIVIQIVRLILLKGWDFSSFVSTFWRWVATFSLTFMAFQNAYKVAPGGTWYLSVMILSMCILYPLLKGAYKASVRVVFPLISLGIFAYLYLKYGAISLVFQWTGFCMAALLRGVAELCLGAALFDLIEWVGNRFENNLLLTAIKVILLLYIALYAFNFALLPKNNIIASGAVFALTFLSFSNVGYTIAGNKITAFLGKISLPIYIFHAILRWVLFDILGSVSIGAFVGLVVGTIAISIALMYFVDFWRKKWNSFTNGSKRQKDVMGSSL